MANKVDYIKLIPLNAAGCLGQRVLTSENAKNVTSLLSGVQIVESRKDGTVIDFPLLESALVSSLQYFHTISWDHGSASGSL